MIWSLGRWLDENASPHPSPLQPTQDEQGNWNIPARPAPQGQPAVHDHAVIAALVPPLQWFQVFDVVLVDMAIM